MRASDEAVSLHPNPGLLKIALVRRFALTPVLFRHEPGLPRSSDDLQPGCSPPRQSFTLCVSGRLRRFGKPLDIGAMPEKIHLGIRHRAGAYKIQTPGNRGQAR